MLFRSRRLRYTLPVTTVDHLRIALNDYCGPLGNTYWGEHDISWRLAESGIDKWFRACGAKIFGVPKNLSEAEGEQNALICECQYLKHVKSEGEGPWEGCFSCLPFSVRSRGSSFRKPSVHHLDCDHQTSHSSLGSRYRRTCYGHLHRAHHSSLTRSMPALGRRLTPSVLSEHQYHQPSIPRPASSGESAREALEWPSTKRPLGGGGGESAERGEGDVRKAERAAVSAKLDRLWDPT